MGRPKGPDICFCCGAVALGLADRKVLSALAHATRPLTYYEVAELTGLNYRSVRRAICARDELFAYGPWDENGGNRRRTIKLSRFGAEAWERVAQAEAERAEEEAHG